MYIYIYIYIYVYICKCICSFFAVPPCYISYLNTLPRYFCHAYIYWLSICANLEQTLGLGFSKDMSVLHESKWRLDADRRLHRLGTERENFESSLSGTAVSAPADNWKVCGSILCMCLNVNENTGRLYETKRFKKPSLCRIWSSSFSSSHSTPRQIGHSKTYPQK